MIGLIVNCITYFQLKRIASKRGPENTYEQFFLRFKNTDREVLESIYKEIQGLVLVDSFPICPDDLLLDDLQIAQGELEDFLEQFTQIKELANLKKLTV